MRVKSLAVAAGLSVITALVLGPAVADASRGSSVEPNIEVPADPVEEAPAEPVEETPAEPVEEAPEVVEEVDPPAVEEEPTPVAKKPAKTTPPTTPVDEEDPVVESAPVVTIEPKKAPAPAPDHGKGHEKKDHAKDPCHMDSYEPRDVDSLSGDEADRAEKVDRNDNGTVCRKDIPGKGRGNTGQGSNIKDDQVR